MRRLLPVAVLFVVLLLLVVWKESSRQTPAETTTTGEVVPLAPAPFAAKDVAKIEVWAPGVAEPAYSVVREPSPAGGDGRWIVETPFRAPAHVGHVDDLAGRVALADAELRTDDPGALAELHLSPDRAVAVRLTAADGRVLAHFAVGKTSGHSAQKPGAFVRLLGDAAGTRAYVTTADLRGSLGLPRTQEGDALPETPKPDHFHDATFPQVNLTRATRLEITAPRRRLAFERKDGKWAVVEGGPASADGTMPPVNVEGLTQVLTRFGSAFQPSGLADPRDLAKLGLAEPAHVVAVTLADGTVRRVFGAADASGETCHVRLDAKQEPDVVYEAANWEWQRLFPAGSSLFELKPFPVADADLERIVVTRGAERLEIVRDGTKPADDWRVAAPVWPLTPRQASLRSLASLLRNVRATDWCDDPALGEEHAVLRFGKRDAPEEALATLRFGGRSPSDRDRLALFPGDAVHAWVITDSTVDRLAAPLLTLFEPRTLHGWSEGDVKAVRVSRRDGEGWKEDYAVLRDGEESWSLVRGGDAKSPASAAAVKSWTERLLSATVKDVLREGGEPAAVRVVVDRTTGASLEFSLSEEKDGRRTGTLGEFRFTCEAKDLVPAADALTGAPAPKSPEPPEKKE